MIQTITYLLEGLWVTAQVVAGGLALAVLLALLSGLAASSRRRWLRWLGRCYVETFRGTSALVQLYWFFFALPQLLGLDMPAMPIGMLVLGLNIGAYGAEVVRGALQAVSSGQEEAGIALGMSPIQRLWRIRLPQAVPAMIPPAGNLAIELMKGSALVTFITLHDVMWKAKILRKDTPDDALEIYVWVMLLFGILALLITGGIRLLERPRIRQRVGIPLLGISLLAGLGVIVAIIIRSEPAPFLETEWSWSFTWQIIPDLLEAVPVTLGATLVGSLLALSVGLVWAGLRRAPGIGPAVFTLTEAVRCTPLLVQLFVVYYGLLPALQIQLDAFVVGSVILGLHYSTYTAEVYRAGLEDVPQGQWEAARALGLSPVQCFARIIVPQAIPRAIPALGNYIIAMFKETPLLMTITVSELLGAATDIQSDHFRGLEPFTLIGVFFLVVSLVATAGVRLLERKLPVRHA